MLDPLATHTGYSKLSRGEAYGFLSQGSPLVEDGSYAQNYYFNLGVLETIEAMLPENGTFTIKVIFSEYGMPKDIWLRALDYSIFGDVTTNLVFTVYLYYPDNGFFVAYQLNGQRGRGSTIGCTDNFLLGKIAIWEPSEWDPTNEKPITDRAKANRESFLLFEGEAWDGKLGERPLVETTSFTIESFYEAVIGSEKPVCIETPFEYWPEFSGSG